VADRAPAFLKLVAHDLRWSIIRELGRSDLRVNELIALVGEAGNLVSYHLGQLRAQGLVRERRSSVDGRVTYYSLDFERFQRDVIEAVSRVRPGLVALPAQPASPRRKRSVWRILFLCTHNSARSQMAEGLLRAAAGDRVVVKSAGSQPTGLHPLAVRAMAQMGIDVRGQHPTHVDELKGERFDIVITLCDAVREVCPPFAGTPEMVHWSLPDPAAEAAEDQPAVFEEVAEEIARRVRYLVILLDERAAQPQPTASRPRR
jgi:ArsR family transcriptional regulator, arsenate/arsenite/antimonite-responsive transcriptional repressor / arsenate reductase (thioredoxin)